VLRPRSILNLFSNLLAVKKRVTEEQGLMPSLIGR